MTNVAIWSGREIRALREARRMSVREFALHLGVSDRMVSKWEAGGAAIRPRPVNQSALDTSLQLSPAETKHRFAALVDTFARPEPTVSAADVGTVVRHPLDGKLMARVEAGPLPTRNGRGRVWVPAFYVDVDPVTVGDYGRYQTETNGGVLNGYNTGEPILGVRWPDAQGYASWAGKQIVTHEQWDRAAEAGAGMSGRQWEWCASPAGALRRGHRRGGPGAFRTAMTSAELHALLAI